MKKITYTLLICLFSISVFADVINKVMHNGKEVKMLDEKGLFIHPTQPNARVFDFELTLTIDGKQKIAKTSEQVKNILSSKSVKGSSAVLKITKATDVNGNVLKVEDVLLTIE